MTSFKKMKLISEEEFVRMKEKQIHDYNPSLRTLAFYQTELDNIISNNSYDSETKEKLFRTAENRFHAIKNKESISLTSKSSVIEEHPIPIADTQAAVDLSTKFEQEPNSSQDEKIITDSTHDTPLDDTKESSESSSITTQNTHLIDSIPIKYRAKAVKLLNFIHENKEKISFDNNFSMLVNGKVSTDSNFSDLFKNLYIKSDSPKGQSEFLNALKSINTPVSLITNKSLFHSLGSLSTRSHKSLSACPPGKRAKILQVYKM